MEDIRDLRDEFSGRLKNLPDHVLARLKAILEGHRDLIRGFNVFLLPSHRFSVDDDDDEDDDSEAAEVAEEEDKMEAAAALAEKTKLLRGFEGAHDFTKKLRMRGKKVWEDFAKILRNAKGISDLFRFIVPLCGDDADFIELRELVKHLHR
ncbi:PREDICTED: paired amphipathic helix protein Sin3-like 3 [Populus euphratica]|uniref:Paired amphipathic helix protein Sin3-like 3 n=1 Tax=Populus euphratica TaxID=75702 RepID=A0AAJ6V4Z5_POPEU|nr:PREDICTED: paired amphipathic helix protein Sin3-like 3 [Populus euphratica]XP_011041913.1 PREDICTED: paired amphipathic helix protein Sin3-like 3 [Populus euphratica]